MRTEKKDLVDCRSSSLRVRARHVVRSCENTTTPRRNHHFDRNTNRHRTPYSLSLSLNRDQLINNFPSLTVYFLPSKLSAADARTQHQPPPVVTPRGKTTDSRKTRQLSHTFLPLLLLLLATDPIPLFHVALLVSSNPHRETIFRASPYSSSRYSSPSSTFSPRMKNLP